MSDTIQPGNKGQIEKMSEAFYIGWMPKSPAVYARHVTKVIMFLFLLALIIALLIAANQKKFSTSNFEFGKLTEVKGIYFNSPVPLLKVIGEKDFLGNASYITIPLVGYGKFGAETAIRAIETEKKISLNNKELTVRGTLLYSDGKTLLQVNKDDDPVKNVGPTASQTLMPLQTDEGVKQIKGEILDPKCYFGVMKPGEGKVHKDCAIRCILGGIPPVLKVMNEKGEKNYYLIIGPDGKPANKMVQDYVAEPVVISARVVRQDDWIILYLQDDKSIQTISAVSLARPDAIVVACMPSCAPSVQQ
ncbi:MAG: hypothetical protein ABJB11_07265 [Ferruginibacter sp.]